MYDPVLKRFLDTDPAGQGFTPYAYAGNNPVLYIDKDRRFWWIPLALGAAINVGVNWDHIDNFWQGFGYATIGAASAGVVMVTPPPLSFALSGAIAGGGNTAIQGGDISTVAEQAGIGAGYVGKYLSDKLGTIVINGVHLSDNSVLAQGIKGAIGGAGGGFVGAFISVFLQTGDISLTYEIALKGIPQGIAISGTVGLASGTLNNIANDLDFWGKPNKSAIIGEGQSRIDSYNKDLKFESISGEWPSDLDAYFGKEINAKYTNTKAMEFNGNWIDTKMNNGYHLFDFGPTGPKISSQFYNMEVGRSMVYPRVHMIKPVIRKINYNIYYYK